jgi:hypothetical protein
MKESLRKETDLVSKLEEHILDNFDKKRFNLADDITLKEASKPSKMKTDPQVANIGWMVTPRLSLGTIDTEAIEKELLNTNRSPHGRKKVLSLEFYDNGGVTCLSPRTLRRSSQDAATPDSPKINRGRSGGLVFS